MRAAVLLTDGVVTVRERRPADAAAVVAACQDPEIARWIPIPQPYTEESFREWALAADEGRSHGTSLELIVADGHDRAIGSVGLKELDRDAGYAEIGYWIAAGARGRGYAARAVRLLRRWAEAELGIERFELLIHPGNAASQRVAAAAGFAPTGELRACPRGCSAERDHLVFASREDDR